MNLFFGNRAQDLKVGKDLKLGSSYIEKLPDNFTVGRNLDLSYSSR